MTNDCLLSVCHKLLEVGDCLIHIWTTSALYPARHVVTTTKAWLHLRINWIIWHKAKGRTVLKTSCEYLVASYQKPDNGRTVLFRAPFHNNVLDYVLPFLGAKSDERYFTRTAPFSSVYNADNHPCDICLTFLCVFVFTKLPGDSLEHKYWHLDSRCDDWDGHEVTNRWIVVSCADAGQMHDSCPRWNKAEGVTFHYTIQNDVQFKAYNLYIWIFHLILSDQLTMGNWNRGKQNHK